MAWTRDFTLSIRENIVLFIVDLLWAMPDPADPAAPMWEKVTRMPLNRSQLVRGNSIGVYDDPETTVDGSFEEYIRTLKVVFEFYVALDTRDEAALTFLSRVRTAVQVAVAADPTFGGLAIDLHETRNEVDVPGPETGHVGAALVATIEYSNHRGDPRLHAGE